MTVLITASMLDQNGKVTVWLTGEKKWGKRFPVDAKEMIRCGVASIHSPDGVDFEGKIAEKTDAFTYDEYNLDDLRELCATSKINFNGLTGPKMIEALRIAKVDPRKDGKQEAEAVVASISSSIAGKSTVSAGG